MQNSFRLLAGLLWLGAQSVSAQTNLTPKIQFDETVYDFGATSQVTTVSGIFHFKNTGAGILHVDPPKPSCGCTAAQVIPDTLPPGTAGIIPFTLNLGFNRGTLVKHITVHSNDPLTPEVSLTIKVDYTPLYNLDPLAISPNIAFGFDETNATTTLTRHPRNQPRLQPQPSPQLHLPGRHLPAIHLMVHPTQMQQPMQQQHPHLIPQTVPKRPSLPPRRLQ